MARALALGISSASRIGSFGAAWCCKYDSNIAPMPMKMQNIHNGMACDNCNAATHWLLGPRKPVFARSWTSVISSGLQDGQTPPFLIFEMYPMAGKI
jgi:hypothetical protein